MRKITALAALLALSFAIPTAHSGDRSGLEPQRSGGSQSFERVVSGDTYQGFEVGVTNLAGTATDARVIVELVQS